MGHVVTFGLLALAIPMFGERLTLSLDGTWDIEETLAASEAPSAFRHRVPVPGLAHLAEPAFADVDRFDSPESLDKKVRLKLLPASALTAGSGIPRQNRNYFWYRTRFRPPARRAVALLRIGKAQFGTAVWLNGNKIGEHLGCFTAGYFDLTGAIDWQAENTLVVRVGAHPAVLPETAPAGTDNEKTVWTPGIYDSVELVLADDPVIESVQVAPRLAEQEVLIETRIRNYGPARTFTLTHRVEGRTAAARLKLGAGEATSVRHSIPMPGAKLWSPEHPFLYRVETTTGGDSVATRFGMREFRFDTATKRAYLNGKPYFLRGSNITLHRFFEDPLSKGLPWNEAWVRKLLGEIPKRMHWNSFRFCIGPVPDRWLEIADETGLLIQNEFFVWGYRKQWDTAEMIRQYQEWMRDNWNHPSVALWDADNETRADVLAEIIRSVRRLDLSDRPWENGYNQPVGPDDPVEDHPYLFSRLGKGFEPADLENMTGAKSTNSAHPSGHAVILNEYGWLWLNRDGSPTELTKDVYARLAGPDADAEKRLELNAYYLGGLTEFWRAHRNFAGVLHFVYLTSSYPGAYTSDHFRDLDKLELEPHFADYLGQAFQPLGVYLNFWRGTLEGGADHRFAVMLVNDEAETAKGSLVLSLVSADGRELARRETVFEVPGFGQETRLVDLPIPTHSGACLLRAAAGSTVSRRKVTIP